MINIKLNEKEIIKEIEDINKKINDLFTLIRYLKKLRAKTKLKLRNLIYRNVKERT